MRLNDLPSGEKKRVNVTLSAKLIEDAKAFGINVSQSAEDGLRAKIKEVKSAQWIEENRDAMLAWNEWVRKNGTFGDKLRAWKKKNGAV
ncbi:MAG: type II toxin-antitoxin system CcdA family antitoxin [Casimicrobium sp.]